MSLFRIVLETVDISSGIHKFPRSVDGRHVLLSLGCASREVGLGSLVEVAAVNG